MKKYNTRKRGTYKAHTRRSTHTHKNYDTYDAQDKTKNIHIDIHYDGYNDTKYDSKIIPQPPRNNETQTYINTTNIINETFPDINAPHNAKTYRANAPYKQIIPPRKIGIEYIPPLSTSQQIIKPYTYTYHDTRRAKCIIFNAHDEIIHIGIFTRTIDINGKDVRITLHRSDREAQVKTYIPLMDKIHGMTIEDIRKHGIEFYHI